MKNLMGKITFPLKIYELLFLFAGLGILISLPGFPEETYSLWHISKISYFLGIPFFIIDK